MCTLRTLAWMGHRIIRCSCTMYTPTPTPSCVLFPTLLYNLFSFSRLSKCFGCTEIVFFFVFLLIYPSRLIWIWKSVDTRLIRPKFRPFSFLILVLVPDVIYLPCCIFSRFAIIIPFPPSAGLIYLSASSFNPRLYINITLYEICIRSSHRRHGNFSPSDEI
jgi:hypothetical protein